MLPNDEELATVPAIAGTLEKPEADEAESSLPATHHEAYRLKLAGESPDEIGKRFGVCRATIWRWCKAVEAEYRRSLEDRPIVNIIAEEIGRLSDLEEQSRQAAATARAGREKALFLGEARRCCTARTSLLTTVGVLPKQPEQIFRVNADLRPAEFEKPKDAGDSMDRDIAIQRLVEQMQKSRTVV